MITRRELLLALLAAPWPFTAHAQRQAKIWKVGLLSQRSRESHVADEVWNAFIAGMHEVGYIEGTHYTIDAHFANGSPERLQSLAADLIKSQPDVIVGGTAEGRLLFGLTRTLPIVLVGIVDPVAEGFAESLARPGKNCTGMTTGLADISIKQVELLKSAVPRLSRIGIVIAASGFSAQIKSLQAAAQRLGVQVVGYPVRTADDITRAFLDMSKQRIDGALILRSAFLNERSRRTAELAMQYRLPTISGYERYAEYGGLMSYGDDSLDRWRRAGTFVVKILRGTKPGEIPFEQPTKYVFSVNRKTATALGLVIPQDLLLRADRVVE